MWRFQCRRCIWDLNVFQAYVWHDALQQHPELVFERVIRKHKANVLYLMFLEKVGGVEIRLPQRYRKSLKVLICSAFDEDALVLPKHVDERSRLIDQDPWH